MKVEARDLRESPYDLQVSAPSAELELEDTEFSFNDDVTGTLRFRMVNQRVIAHGQVATRIGTNCSRCLTPITVPLSAVVDAVYENNPELLKAENKAFGDADQLVSYFNGEKINPAPEIREALMLELPMLPLCKEDCKGLCPQCGTNLNEQECSCGDKDDNKAVWKDALKNIKLQG